MFSVLNPTVIVVALGYFVDIFDLTLFNMLRVSSLESLKVPSDQIIEVGILLLNSQMAGMLIGGVFWGVLGDKKGRLNVLFASILLYSVANIANAFVTDIYTYAILRFISGVGLAGELGAGITLISEILPQKQRGLGTTFVATVGVFGATFGAILVEYFHWTTCYIIGGVLGLILLFLRIQIGESNLFKNSLIVKKDLPHLQWGNFWSLFRSRKQFSKFYHVVMIGVPIWYIAGLVMAFSPELSKQLGVIGDVTSSKAIGISYLGLGLGDFLSGLLSQYLESRKKVIFIFLMSTILFLFFLFSLSSGKSSGVYYLFCFLIGIGAGFWAIFVTVAAEQFGTNMRATVATSVPNFVRGSVIPVTLFFKFLKANIGIVDSMVIVGVVVFSFSLISWFYLEETFHRDLEFFEH